MTEPTFDSDGYPTRILARRSMERIAAQVAEGYAAVNRWPAFYKATVRSLPAGDVLRIFAASAGDQLDQGDIAAMWRELDHGEFLVSFNGITERHAVVRIENGIVVDMVETTPDELDAAEKIRELSAATADSTADSRPDHGPH